jgi:hypothetical protein
LIPPGVSSPLSPTPLENNSFSALRIAARFFDRSTDTKTFKRGMNAYKNRDFYRQLGKDPRALEVLAKRFGL